MLWLVSVWVGTSGCVRRLSLGCCLLLVYGLLWFVVAVEGVSGLMATLVE
jgi:hypothetical protein